MKKILLCLTCIVLFALNNKTHAQQISPLTKIKVPFNEDTEVFSFSDETGITILFKENEEARLYLLNHDLTVKTSYTIYDLPSNQSLVELGFTNRPDELSLYYWDETSDNYRALAIRKNDGTSSLHTFNLGRTRKGHLYWGSFTYDGMLHVLRMPRNSQVIRICKFEGEDDFSTEEYKIGKRDFLEKTEYKLTRISDYEELGLKDTYLPGKLYQNGEMVYLSLDEADSTFLVTINLRTGEKSERAYACPEFNFREKSSSKIKTNSIIYENHLYQVAANREALSLQIRNLATNKIVQKYQFKKEEYIDIRQGDMEYISESGQVFSLRNTQELLVQIDDADHLAISLKPEESAEAVLLTIGAVQISSVLGVSGVILEENISTAFFQSLLDKWRFQPYPGPLAEVSDRKVRMSNLPGKTQWKANGRSFWGYYDYKRGEYVIGN